MANGGDGDGFDASDDAFVFDEAFVQGASVRELTAVDRARRAKRIADQGAEAAAAEAARKEAAKRARRARRPHRRLLHALPGARSLARIALVLAVLGGGTWFLSRREAEPTDANWESAAAVAAAVDAGARPTPTEAKTMVRLSSRPFEPPDEGRRRFLATQGRSDAAVSYDPCRVIKIVVNPRTMPPEAKGLLEDAFELVGNLSGLQFEVEGTTDEPSGEQRPSFQPDRYGDRWAPVLVSWSDREEDPGLAGDTVGRARSDFVDARGRSVYVSGHVALDGPEIAGILAVDAPDSPDHVVDIILHEIGHLVGLDHVDDPEELMFPEGRGERHGFGPGDRRGLYELGGGRCLESI